MHTYTTMICPFLSTPETKVHCFNGCALYTETEIDEETTQRTCAIAKIAELLNKQLS